MPDKKIIKIFDLGTHERHAKKDVSVINTDGELRAVVHKISPIHLYHNRKQISQEQFIAGNKLYVSYVTAWVGFKNTELIGKINTGCKPMIESEAQVVAYDTYKKGMNAVKEYIDIIRSVVIDEMYIGDSYKHWYTRKKAKEQLRKGLDLLAIEYGYLDKHVRK